jgi:hypothetical protein
MCRPNIHQTLQDRFNIRYSQNLFGAFRRTKVLLGVQANNIAGSGPWSQVSDFTIAVTDVKEEAGIPTEYSISQNYPNLFNPTTKTEFALPRTARTDIVIYDLLGREVQTLIHKELKPGYYEMNVDASIVPSGVYFYRIQSAGVIQTKKMVLMK